MNFFRHSCPPTKQSSRFLGGGLGWLVSAVYWRMDFQNGFLPIMELQPFDLLNSCCKGLTLAIRMQASIVRYPFNPYTRPPISASEALYLKRELFPFFGGQYEEITSASTTRCPSSFRLIFPTT